jgi:hypothetical protein
MCKYFIFCVCADPTPVSVHCLQDFGCEALLPSAQVDTTQQSSKVSICYRLAIAMATFFPPKLRANHKTFTNPIL